MEKYAPGMRTIIRDEECYMNTSIAMKYLSSRGSL